MDRTWKMIPLEKFIAAVMKHPSASAAARALGISRQAVSRRVKFYREKGVKGLPDYDVDIDTGDIQKLVDKHRKER